MPRLNPIDPAQAEGQAKVLLDGVRKKYGMVPNLLATLANAPAALEGYLGLGQTLAGGSLDAKTREAIALTVAGENGCDYCAAAHSAIGAGLGVAAEELGTNLRGRSSDPRVTAILRFAKGLSVEQPVSPTEWAYVEYVRTRVAAWRQERDGFFTAAQHAGSKSVVGTGPV